MPLKDKELQNYYDDIAKTCSSKGWKHFLEQVNAMVADYNDVMRVKDAEVLRFRQGQLDVLNWIKKYKEMHETAYETLEAEENA